MFPFDYVLIFLRYIVNIFIFTPVEMDKHKQKIYVKWPSSMVPIYVSQDWTVQDLKTNVGEKVNVKPEDVCIIFAGKELHDEVRLLDCDVGEMSVIHAVPSRRSNSQMRSSTPIANLTSKLCDDNFHSSESEATSSGKVHFFVYCNDPCKSMAPGKLRVRCSKCKEGTLTLDRDPACWDDVLKSNQITGLCQSEDCDGTIAEFYFKCSKHTTLQNETSVALFLVKNNFKSVPCIACTDVSIIILVFPCEDGHVMCLDCFKLYCTISLNEHKFIQDENVGYTIKCPAGCNDSLIKEPHHFKLLEEELYFKYQRFGAEECLLQAGGVLCPRPGCGSGIIPDPDCNRIVCVQQGSSGCGFVFCRLCREGFHIGLCNESSLESSSTENVIRDITDERADCSRWDSKSKTTIQSTTKPCPKCRTPTERNGGCMHMVCIRSQCGFHWCWICQSEWTRDCMGNHWFE